MSHTYRHHHAWRRPQSWRLPAWSCPQGRRRCSLCSRAKLVRFKLSRSGAQGEEHHLELVARGV